MSVQRVKLLDNLNVSIIRSYFDKLAIRTISFLFCTDSRVSAIASSIFNLFRSIFIYLQ